jgi:RimJ/RimL family protein N-acetyltransferase
MNPIRLTTKRLVLREIRSGDWVEAQRLDSDPNVVRFQSNDVVDEAGTKEYLAKSIAAQTETPRKVFDLAVTEPGDDRYLGRCGLAIRRPDHKEAELWFNLRHDLWGKGIATEATRALVDFAFDQLGLHRVYGDCDPRNKGSARVMEKLGFKREAHLRENWWLKGEWCDALIYAVLDREWRSLRGK